MKVIAALIMLGFVVMIWVYYFVDKFNKKQ